jgi:hypothetical protein
MAFYGRKEYWDERYTRYVFNVDSVVLISTYCVLLIVDRPIISHAANCHDADLAAPQNPTSGTNPIVEFAIY